MVLLQHTVYARDVDVICVFEESRSKEAQPEKMDEKLQTKRVIDTTRICTHSPPLTLLTTYKYTQTHPSVVALPQAMSFPCLSPLATPSV